MKLTTFSRLSIVLSALLLWSEHVFAVEQDRPRGLNCQLVTPAADAGEESGHGVFLQVYPRTSAIGPTYTGCQAVFITTAAEGTRLAWLIEVSKGNAVRMWSSAPEGHEILDCRYKQGSLLNGDPHACPAKASDLLLSTQPAGCIQGTRKGPECEYDKDL
jgi:hypothetical protein